MRISEGNIFEAMRLVLPEHREKMAHFEREHKKVCPPNLAPDKQYEMSHILGTAIKEEREVKISLFDPYENKLLIGVPSYKNGKLFLTNGSTTYPLLKDQIIHVEEI